MRKFKYVPKQVVSGVAWQRHLVHALFATLTVCAVPQGSYAIEPDQVIQGVRNRANGAEIYSDVTLILTDQNGNKRERKLIYLQKDDQQDDLLTLYFKSPSDVFGVGFQSVNYEESDNKDDEQWIYLPAFRKVRRISSGDKRGAFMGSEFAYIDLDKIRISDYRQTLLGEETIDGRECYVLERIPVSDEVITKTGYNKLKVWIDKNHWVVKKQQYFDARGILFKELNLKRVEQIQGFVTEMESEMRDFVSNRSSTLIFNNVRYDLGLNNNLFKQEILKTGVSDANLPTLR